MTTHQLICSECGWSHDLQPHLYLCPDCSTKNQPNQPLHGVLDIIRVTPGPRVYLPVNRQHFPPVPVGDTPLWSPTRLRSHLGDPNLVLKDDTRNPTCSLKDRASYLVAAFARQHQLTTIALASTGNAASSMAGIGAASGLRVVVFLPQDAPEAKLIQSLQYGAHVFRVAGGYDDAYELSLQFCAEIGALSRNTGYNPLTIEGKKTVAIELVEQMNRCPDILFVPAGDGVILSGVYKGLQDLKDDRRIDAIPKVIAVQAQGSRGLDRGMRGDFSAVPAQTIADSISVDAPRNGRHAVGHLKRYGGSVVCVEDDDILEAQRLLASKSGLFVEPAAAAAFAGYLCIRDQIQKDTYAAVLLTGSGLKDIRSARKAVRVPSQTVGDLNDVLNEWRSYD